MVAEELRIGVIGTGALGRHHTRILADLSADGLVDLVGVHDIDGERASEVAAEHGTVAVEDPERLFELLEAAVLAVPTTEHSRLGCELLERGIHILVEKPIAARLDEADALVEAAERSGLVLGVGHVEFFNPAVQRLLSSDRRARFVEVQRLGVFSPRSLDVDVVLDLMVHDLQILHALDSSDVEEVRATGIDVLSPRVDIANVRLELASGCVANLTASRVSSDKVRKLRVFSPRSYCSVDYQDQSIKGYRLVEGGERPRIERDDLTVERAEPLRRELEEFVAVCRGEEGIVVGGAEARRALETALAIVEEIESG